MAETTIIRELWRLHAERCKFNCRSTDGARCSLARAIQELHAAMEKVDATLLAAGEGDT